MSERPNLAILDRDEAIALVRQHFADQVRLLTDLTDYGTNLILRCFNSSAKELPDVLVCGVLLKHVVAMVDAAEILLDQGALIGAFLPARSAFEASVYADWICFSDSERKARCYLVANYRAERLWARRIIKGTSEEAAFTPLANSLGLDIHARRPTLASEAAKHLEEVNRILEQPAFAEIDSEFSSLARKKRGVDPEWYKLAGATSFRHVSKQVGRLPEYSFFYSRGSDATHAASYKLHLRFQSGSVHLKPIRNLEHVNELLNFLVATVLHSYRGALRRYRPAELEAFGRQYASDWRAPFLTIKRVEYLIEAPAAQ